MNCVSSDQSICIQLVELRPSLPELKQLLKTLFTCKLLQAKLLAFASAMLQNKLLAPLSTPKSIFQGWAFAALPLFSRATDQSQLLLLTAATLLICQLCDWQQANSIGRRSRHPPKGGLAMAAETYHETCQMSLK